MRVVILASSVYSESACAMAVRLAQTGNPPAGALALSTFNRETLFRKIGQWGLREATRFVRTKISYQTSGGDQPQLHNPCLQPFLKHNSGYFRNLREVASSHNFPVAVCRDQNASDGIARLRAWGPDLIVFAGGNILRKELLDLPRLGVLNVHLGLLPEIRGMSSPEWSLLNGVPLGITIHYMDAGIDTGPVLRRYALPAVSDSESLAHLRMRLIALGVEKLGEVVAALDHGTVSPTPQSTPDEDRQFFVMHEWLQARAAEQLARNCMPKLAGIANG